MKTVIIFLIFLMVGIAGEKPEAQKFEVTYTIKYNSVTLLEAAKLEEKIRQEYKDACKINVDVGGSMGVQRSESIWDDVQYDGIQIIQDSLVRFWNDIQFEGGSE